jgi:HEAT repeat protein
VLHIPSNFADALYKQLRRRKGVVMSEWDRIIADLHKVGEDTDGAVAACKALDKAADESWLPRLHRLLAEGRDFFVREAAAFPIARLEGLRALPQLLHALHLGEDEGHDNDGLAFVVTDLVEANSEEAAPALRRMIRGRSERQRSDAAWLWGFAARSLTPEPLLAALSDTSPRVRSSAVGSLGSFKGREGAFAGMVQALMDPEESVRSSAASALGYYGDRRAILPLRQLQSDSCNRVRKIVEYALQQLENIG